MQVLASQALTMHTGFWGVIAQPASLQQGAEDRRLE